MNGKGDTPRKKTVSQETWDKNYEKIFGKKSKNNSDNFKDKKK